MRLGLKKKKEKKATLGHNTRNDSFLNLKLTSYMEQRTEICNLTMACFHFVYKNCSFSHFVLGLLVFLATL